MTICLTISRDKNKLSVLVFYLKFINKIQKYQRKTKVLLLILDCECIFFMNFEVQLTLNCT